MQAHVRKEIGEFILAAWSELIADAIEYGEFDITVAINEEGSVWAYQTGDNSYTGSCYGLPHWAVTAITVDSKPVDIAAEIFEQLAECEV